MTQSGKLITAGNRKIARSPGELTGGPPYLWIFVLPSEDTRVLFAEFVAWFDKFDEVAGESVQIIHTGNPALIAPVYEQIRTEELAERDHKDTAIYHEELKSFGGTPEAEIVLRLRWTRAVAGILHLQTNQLPCVAFCTRPDWLPPSILPIKGEWLDTDRSKRSFMDTLYNWFEQRRYEKAIPPGTTVGFVHENLKLLLQRLSGDIDRAVGCAGHSGSRGTTVRRVARSSVQLKLDRLREGKIWQNRCALLVGENRYNGFKLEIGVRQLFFFWLFFNSNREETVGGQACLVITEKEGVQELINWSTDGYITLQGLDQSNVEARFRKNWNQFNLQVQDNSMLNGLFNTSSESDWHGKRLYTINLKLGEVQVLIPNISSLLKAMKNKTLL